MLVFKFASKYIPSSESIFLIEGNEFVFYLFAGNIVFSLVHTNEVDYVSMKNRHNIYLVEIVHVNDTLVIRAKINCSIYTHQGFFEKIIDIIILI